MKEKRVWIGLAVLFAVIGVPQLFWKPSRFSGIFLLALAIGCMGEWLMLRGREKHKACRILSRVGRVLFALFVLSFAAVQVFVIGIAFDEDDPSAAPQADTIWCWVRSSIRTDSRRRLWRHGAIRQLRC